LPALTVEQKEHFEEYGFVHVPDVFDPEGTIDPVIDEYAGVLDSLADKLYSEGAISSIYSDLEFGLLSAAKQCSTRYPVLGRSGRFQCNYRPWCP
jgi:hypothetical protein